LARSSPRQKTCPGCFDLTRDELHDFRGQLASEKPDNGYTGPQIADDCAKLLDHVGVEACHLVGTSFGGVIAQTFAINYPDRVKSLVLIATASAADEAIGRGAAFR
jgi:pimeloyl-ACP methyl ester carboxylesterase